jgi:Holliday junction resolvasome RuvABC endonuclease subunit
MRVLGLDCALRRTGWAALDGTHITADVCGQGVIETTGLSHALALRELGREVARLCAQFTPAVAAIETPGGADRNRQRKLETVIALAEARGVALAAVAAAGVRDMLVDQAAVKEAVATRYAGKAEIQQALRHLAAGGALRQYTPLLRPRGGVDADAADAVAIAFVGLRRLWLEEGCRYR